LLTARGALDARGQEFRISYHAALVEESVLLAERRLDAGQADAFRAERDRIYGVADPDEREARFEELHGRYFLQLGLDRPLHQALAGLPELCQRASGCKVLPAASRRQEGADLRQDRAASPGAGPVIVLQLLAQSLLDPDTLRTLLDRELLHVADMLDPGFGYAHELPRSDDDPALANLLRERYRVVWDATIDGRLCRRGLLAAQVRAARLAEFTRAFPMLRGSARGAFGRWFDGPRPTHAAILAFAQQPLGAEAGDGARCPLCRLPAPLIECDGRGLAGELVDLIEREHPGWRPEHGCCARCAEVYAVLATARA
jgi:hypothetical protein